MEKTLGEGWESGEKYGLPPEVEVFDGRENIHRVRMMVDPAYRAQQEKLEGIPWYERTAHKGTAPAVVSSTIIRCIDGVVHCLSGK